MPDDDLERAMKRFDDFSARVKKRRVDTRAAVLTVLESLQAAFERYPIAERFEVSHCRDVVAAIQELGKLLEPLDPSRDDGSAEGS